MNIGAFLVLASLTRKGITGEDINDLNGLMQKAPGHAIWMLIFLLSLAGIPPTAGFIGKYFIFLSLIETGRYALAVIACLYVAVSIYYYFRIVRSIFISKADNDEPLTTSLGTRVALGFAGLMTLVMGIYPEPFIGFVARSLSR
jgi:NADH-quinone oxidoreductase subunit N